MIITGSLYVLYQAVVKKSDDAFGVWSSYLVMATKLVMGHYLRDCFGNSYEFRFDLGWGMVCYGSCSFGKYLSSTCSMSCSRTNGGRSCVDWVGIFEYGIGRSTKKNTAKLQMGWLLLDKRVKMIFKRTSWGSNWVNLIDRPLQDGLYRALSVFRHINSHKGAFR